MGRASKTRSVVGGHTHEHARTQPSTRAHGPPLLGEGVAQHEGSRAEHVEVCAEGTGESRVMLGGFVFQIVLGPSSLTLSLSPDDRLSMMTFMPQTENCTRARARTHKRTRPTTKQLIVSGAHEVTATDERHSLVWPCFPFSVRPPTCLPPPHFIGCRRRSTETATHPPCRSTC